MNLLHFFKSINPFAAPMAIADSFGHGRGYPLIVDGDSLTAGDARAILAESGIDSWALLDRGTEWSFYVAVEEAQRAEALLKRHGAVILGRQLVGDSGTVADEHDDGYRYGGEVQSW